MTLWSLVGLTLAALVGATLTGQVLRRIVRSGPARLTVANMNVRVAAWWVLCGAMALALAVGEGAAITLFALFSVLAQREFATVASVRRDHPRLFWWFLVFTPLQYWFIWSRRQGMFGVLIPACAFFGILFLKRTAKIFSGLLVCTYGLSHAPALLMLEIPEYAGRDATLLFYFLLVVQSSDVLQWVWGKLLGRRLIAPRISPHKTWEGFLGGVIASTALGTALYRATPFQPWPAAGMCAAITLAGFAGGLAMSAVKRDCGVKDYGTIIAGHGGVLDRADSLCFSAPIFFHLTRLFYTL